MRESIASAACRLLWGALVLSAGCFSPNFDDGAVACGDGEACPPDYFCGPDNHCYRDGTPLDDAGIDAQPFDASSTVHLLGENTVATTKGVTADTFLDDEVPTQINGTHPEIQADIASASGFNEVALLRFDLSSIPSSAEVTEASLHLWTTDPTEIGIVSVYSILESWNELEANWTNRTTTDLWTTAGAGSGSRSDTALTSFAPAALGLESVVSLPTSIIESWLADPSSNFGVAMTINNENGVDFASSNEPDESVRPYLEITVK